MTEYNLHLRKEAVLALIALAFAPMAYYGIQVERPASDENVYFYQAKLVSEGYVPYRDFFLSHPPGFIYLTALIMKILGASIKTLKIVPLACAFTVLALTYLLGEKEGRGTGALACILTLAFSEHFHHLSHINLGLMVTTALTLSAYYLHATGRRLHSGIVIALAAYTRLNALPILAYLALRSCLEGDKRFFKGIILTAPLFLIVFITPNAVEDVILYRLREDPEAFTGRLTQTYKFLRGELPIIALSFVFLGIAFKTNDGNIRKTFTRWREGDESLSLVALPLFFLAFTLLFQRRIYSTYFMLIIPYIAVTAAMGLKKIAGSGDFARIAVASILIVYLAYQGAGLVSNAYKTQELNVLGLSSEYVARNTEPGDTVFFMQYVGGPKIALDTGTRIADNIVAPTTHLVYAYKDTINQTILEALGKKPVIVSTELRMLQEMTNEGIDTTQIMEYLRENYWPDQIVLGEKTVDTLVFWKLKENKNYSDKEYAQPTGKRKNQYVERYHLTFDGEEAIEDFVFEKDAATQPTIPAGLAGDNIYEVALIVNETIIKWPLTEKTHYNVEGNENMTSEVWVSSVRDNVMEIMVFTWWEDETARNLLSLSAIRYDTVDEVFITFRCYSRLGYPISDFYNQIYQQVLVSEEEYRIIAEVLDKRKSGLQGTGEDSLEWK